MNTQHILQPVRVLDASHALQVFLILFPYIPRYSGWYPSTEEYVVWTQFVFCAPTQFVVVYAVCDRDI